MAIKHAYTSSVSDSGKTELVQPSNWNAAHVITDFGASIIVASSIASDAAKAAALASGGSVCDGTADDVEIQAAIDTLPNNRGRVVLSEGTFYLSATLTITQNTALVGQGMGDSTTGITHLIVGHVNPGIQSDNPTLTRGGILLEDFLMRSTDGFYPSSFINFTKVGGSRINRISIKGQGAGDTSIGILVATQYYNTIRDVIITYVNIGIQFSSVANDNQVYSPRIGSCNTHGIYITGASKNISLYSPNLEGDATGIKVDANYATVYSPYFEGNTTDIEFTSSGSYGRIYNPFFNSAPIITDAGANNTIDSVSPILQTRNNSNVPTKRASFTGGLATDVLTWVATTHSGMVLTSPTINGTIATTSIVTLPAVTLGGNMTVTGYAFDAGAGSAQINTTGAGVGLIVQSTQDGDNGARLWGKHITASVAVGDEPLRLLVEGRNAAGGVEYYGELHYKITDITAGAEACGMTFTVFSAGAQNDGMTLSGAGVLAVDLGGSGSAAQVDLFDDYDDALVLKQGIQQNNRELLANMGVLERKDTGSGYMMKIQPMVRLLAGGIYQTRALIDDLTKRLAIAEKKLALLPEGVK